MATVRRVLVGDTLPARLTSADMMRIFNLKKSRFWALVTARQFDHLEMRPRIGRRAWSGALVRAYLDGQVRELSVVRRRA